jgi:hypothetical protein
MDPPQDDADEPLERVQSASVSARVPAGVSGGVFATGVIVLHSASEVMVDFVQGIVNPRQIGVRVVMATTVAVQFVGALEENLGLYETTFGVRPREPLPAAAASAAAGSPAAVPASDVGSQSVGSPSGGGQSGASNPAAAPESGGGSAAAPQQPIADAYSQLKVTDEVLGGAYANTVTISHTGSEFHFDFINRGFPRSVVTARVYMAAPRVPSLLDSLKRSLRIT